MQRVLFTSICLMLACGFAMPGTAGNAAEPPPIARGGPMPQTGPQVSVPVKGTWIVEFANGVTETYWFVNTEQVQVFQPRQVAGVKQTVKDNSVEIVFDDDRVERWTRVGNRHVVERWSPGSKFPTATPLRGIAESPPDEITLDGIWTIFALGGRVTFRDRRARLLVSFEGPRTVTDMYICNLEQVKDLTALRLVDTDVTDNGLMQLARGRRSHDLWKGDGLKKLTHLEFTGTLDDTGLLYLGEMTQLRQLHLQRTGLVTDAGLNHLKGLTNLESLILTSCKVTDAGLAHLKGLTRLEALDLSETTVSDAGLEHLKGLTGLKLLVVKRTNVTETGVKKLQQDLPNCMISHSPRD